MKFLICTENKSRTHCKLKLYSFFLSVNFFSPYYTLNIRNTFSDRIHVNLVVVPDENVVAMREGLQRK